MALIVMGTIAMMFDSARLANAAAAGEQWAVQTAAALFVLNIMFTAVFTVEMVMKVTAWGIRGYVSDAWNWLDASIVLISIISLLDFLDFLRPLRALRTLRALRPLRLVSRYPALQVQASSPKSHRAPALTAPPALQLVVEALFLAMPAIFNVLLVLLLFWLVFGLLGVQLFAGQFGSCVLYVPPGIAEGTHLLLPIPNLTAADACATADAELEALDAAGGWGSGELCERQGGGAAEARCTLLWRTPSVGFDNILEAMVTLSEVATMQGWSDMMHRAMAVRGAGAAVYFMGFIVLGNFILIKLFAGVVIDNFNQLRDQKSGCAYMTEAQREWVETRKLLLRMRPVTIAKPPCNPIRLAFYRVVTHRLFEALIIGAILLNVCFMALVMYPTPDTVDDIQSATNLVFTIVFILEAALKLIAYFPRRYFSTPWNVFDFFLVLVSIFDLLMPMIPGLQGGLVVQPMVLRVLRIFRIARLLRLVRSARSLRTLLNTIGESIPALLNVTSLLMLTAIIFAILGMSLFGQVIPQRHYGYVSYASFDNFGSAMLLMLRMATSDDWQQLMHACMVQPPFCGPAAGKLPSHLAASDAYLDCGTNFGGGVVAVIYFMLAQVSPAPQHCPAEGRWRSSRAALTPWPRSTAVSGNADHEFDPRCDCRQLLVDEHEREHARFGDSDARVSGGVAQAALVSKRGAASPNVR